MSQCVDSAFMIQCVDLVRGLNHTNKRYRHPFVGALLVYQGRVIASGVHKYHGDQHAEAQCIQQIQDVDILSKSTLYSTLECCNHIGKNPACCDLIIKSGIPRVVIGHVDPNPIVQGSGLARLRAAGIDVKIDVASEVCLALNPRFMTYHQRKRPYIILKWAQSQDGFIGPVVHQDDEGSHWMSSQRFKQIVHEWRSEEEAILVGCHTVVMDNPLLTVRAIKRPNPIRILLDSHLSVTNNASIFNKHAVTVIFNNHKQTIKGHDVYIKVNPHDLSEVLAYCHRLMIHSILVEGGAEILNAFIHAGLWDEARVLTVNNSYRQGIKSPVLTNACESDQQSWSDGECLRFYTHSHRKN